MQALKTYIKKSLAVFSWKGFHLKYIVYCLLCFALLNDVVMLI